MYYFLSLFICHFLLFQVIIVHQKTRRISFLDTLIPLIALPKFHFMEEKEIVC